MEKRLISLRIDSKLYKMIKYFKQCSIIEYDEDITMTKIFELGAETYLKDMLREWREEVLSVPTNRLEVESGDEYEDVLVKYINRKYDPNSVKMHFTSNGAAKKNLMAIHYLKKEHQLKDFKFNLDSIKSPVEDVVDSYAVATLLQLELKLRKGIIQLRDLSEKQIQIFNRVTKSNPTNILSQDFISKGEINE